MNQIPNAMSKIQQAAISIRMMEFVPRRDIMVRAGPKIATELPQTMIPRCLSSRPLSAEVIVINLPFFERATLR